MVLDPPWQTVRQYQRAFGAGRRVLNYRYQQRSRGATEWKDIEQRVPITWTACHFGGRRPWFVCSCGRRVAVLYGAGELFACRRCYGLAYASQQESPRDRSLHQAQKIGRRLGGSLCIWDAFPEKPPRMHWRTFRRLAARGERLEGTFNSLLAQWVLPLEGGSQAEV